MIGAAAKVLGKGAAGLASATFGSPAWTVPSAKYLEEDVAPKVKGIFDRDKRLEAEIRVREQIQQEQDLRRREVTRLRRSLARNAATLAAMDPDLYNQVMAGRRLSRGTLMLGGAPRTDLLEELASAMGEGAFSSKIQDEEGLTGLESAPFLG